MSEYLVRFIAHIDERKRPENFPKVISIDESFAVETLDQLSQGVNNRFKNLVSAPGIVALKNPDEILEQNVMTFDKRVYIPWHMITHFEASVNLITPPVMKDPLDISGPVDAPATEPSKDIVN